MTALGPYVSDREPIRIFNNPPRVRTSDREQAYRIAKDTLLRMEHDFSQKVDTLIGDQAAIDEAWDEVVRFTKHVHQLYEQWQCPHPPSMVEIIGDERFGGERPICLQCGAEGKDVYFHAINLPENVNEIP